MQLKYWKYMVQMKAWVYYLEIYAENSYKWDKRINIIGAIASSSSIAAWAVWQEYSFIWAFVIAVSQVLSAIKEFLPFERRLKFLNSFKDDICVLCIKMEYDWYSVAQGELTEEEINSVLYTYKKAYTEIEGKYSKEEVLVENTEYMDEADIKATQYFQNNYKEE